MSRYGVIDLGSNTVRLVVYDVSKNNKAHKGDVRSVRFHSLINDKVMASLASYVENGMFSHSGIKRASDVVAGHLRRATGLRCEHVGIFATAVLRNARNGASAVTEIERRCNTNIDLLSGSNEARLGFLGASYKEEMHDGVLIDIGGGSTELTRIADGTPQRSISIPDGALSLYENFVSQVIPSASELQKMRHAFEARLDTVSSLDDFCSANAWGIGGSIRAAAKFIGGSTRPKSLSSDNIAQILAGAQNDASAFAHRGVKASPERIHTILPGCVALLCLMERLNTNHIHVCKYGLREGYLLDRLLRISPRCSHK